MPTVLLHPLQVVFPNQILRQVDLTCQFALLAGPTLPRSQFDLSVNALVAFEVDGYRPGCEKNQNNSKFTTHQNEVMLKQNTIVCKQQRQTQEQKTRVTLFFMATSKLPNCFMNKDCISSRLVSLVELASLMAESTMPLPSRWREREAFAEELQAWNDKTCDDSYMHANDMLECIVHKGQVMKVI